MGEKYQIPKAPDIDFEAMQREAQRKASEAPATEEKKLEMERSELNTLVDKGAQYTIRYVKRTGLLHLRPKQITKTFTIHEPTLAILDEISAIGIDLELENEEMAKGHLNTISAARRAVRKNAWKLCRIIAIATLGEGAYEIKGDNIAAAYGIGIVRRSINKRRVTNLARLIYATARPSQIAAMANIVMQQSNLGSFIHSIRLLSARTTEPRTELVE